jgi:prevent-host-death family protein
MTERLAQRDLRNRSSEVLREVAAGATYEITNRGEVVAVLPPPEGRHELRARAALVRGGFADRPPVSRTERVQVVDELRDER